MEKGTHGGMGDDLRPEYDLSRLLRGSVRGKYAERFIALDANTSSSSKTDEVAVQKPTDTSASTAINDESSIENGDGLSPTALLLRAMEASMDEQGNVKGSMLHDTMRRIDPGFDFKKLGHSTFTRFLESSSDVKVMRSDGPGDMIIQLLHPQTE